MKLPLAENVNGYVNYHVVELLQVKLLIHFGLQMVFNRNVLQKSFDFFLRNKVLQFVVSDDSVNVR